MKNWTEIIESLDSKVKVKAHNDIDLMGEFETEFFVGPMEFRFTAEHGQGGDVRWLIVFSRRGFGLIGSSFDVLNDLNLKQTLKVFSGIKKSMELFVKAVNKSDTDLAFWFSAKAVEKSRVKLYDKFAKQLAKKYKMTVGISNVDGEKVYNFYRVK